MPTTKIIIRSNKAKKNNEAPLYIRVIKDRKAKIVSLKLYVNPKYWDADKEKVKPGHPNSVWMNNYLAEKTREALDSLLELETNNPGASALDLKHSVMGVAKIDFIKFGEHYIKKYENNGKIGTYRRYKSVLEKLKDYAKSDKFEFNEFSMDFFRNFEAYLKAHYKNKHNTIVSNFKVLRQIYNQAYKEQRFKIKVNPFTNFKLSWESSERTYLTEEEIKKLEDLKLDKKNRHYHYLNMYLFACYAGGVRVSDLLQLRWENYVNDHIILQTQKTGSIVSVKLPQKALTIIDLYKSKDALKDDFIFPLLKKSDDLDNPTTLLHRIAVLTTSANNSLQELAINAKIHKHISFHSSRHTFATRALQKGMRIEYVSKLMGHNSIRTTQIYAKIVNADLDKAMEIFDEVPAVPEEKKEKAVTKKKSKK